MRIDVWGFLHVIESRDVFRRDPAAAPDGGVARGLSPTRATGHAAAMVLASDAAAALSPGRYKSAAAVAVSEHRPAPAVAAAAEVCARLADFDLHTNLYRR
jgi:hypothetical protein